MKKLIIYLTILLAVSFHSCKKDDSTKNNKNFEQQTETSNGEKEIDTSYKKNIRLFDQFYYGMPEKIVFDINKKINDSSKTDQAILTYKNENVYFKKQFFYTDGLLNKVQLVSYNTTNKRENSPIILELFNSKYGKSEFKEDIFETDETQTIATKIINFKEPSGLSTIEPYDPKIHKDVSKKEFNDYINHSHQIRPYTIANNELHIVKIGGESFYKIMKDITKDEIVKIPVKVAIKKINYKKIITFNEHIWRNGEKKIRLYCFKSIRYQGNKYQPVEINLNKDLIVTFTRLEKNNPIQEEENSEDPKLREKKTIDAI